MLLTAPGERGGGTPVAKTKSDRRAPPPAPALLFVIPSEAAESRDLREAIF